MGESTGNGNTGLFELTGKIMVVAILLLFFLVVFVFCLHLYAKWFWQQRRQERDTTATTTRRRRLSFAAGHQEITVVVPAPRRGLDTSVLKNIPVVLFDPNEFKDGLECAVCLSEVSEGEKMRLLPKCNHGFHVECIDMWFHSHSTCPLCRNPVSESSTLESILQAPPMVENSISSSTANIHSTETSSFPTNVLFCGRDTTVEDHPSTSSSSSSSSSSTASSTSNNGMLVIDIPRQTNYEEEDENKSPIYTRLRSLTRLLSGGNRRVNPSSTPRNSDPEQGVITEQS